jgi:hypothetical protein
MKTLHRTPAVRPYHSRRFAKPNMSAQLAGAAPAPVAKALPATPPVRKATPPDPQAIADARAAVEAVLQTFAQEWAQAGADAVVRAHAQEWAQAGANAAVQALAAAGMLRRGRPVELKSVIRDASGFIVGSIAEDAEIIEDTAP